MNTSALIDSFRRLLNEKLRQRAPSAVDPADDLSYEDALLDLQLRNYFKAEYGMAEPPSGIYPRLLAAIRAHERGTVEAKTSRPMAAFVSLYGALRTSTAHRLVSGGVAIAFLMAVVSSSSVSFLRATSESLVIEEITPTVSTLSSDETLELATNRDERYLVNRPSIFADTVVYDPVELRIPARPDAASGSVTPSRWKRFGGQ